MQQTVLVAQYLLTYTGCVKELRQKTNYFTIIKMDIDIIRTENAIYCLINFTPTIIVMQ